MKGFSGFKKTYGVAFVIIQFIFGSMLFARDFNAKTINDFERVTVLETQNPFNATDVDFQSKLQGIAKSFYQTHSDNYDFLVVFTNFKMIMPPSQIQNQPTTTKGFYTYVKNDTSGIGLPLIDETGDFGSQGKLQGILNMGFVGDSVTDPTDPQFEQTMGTLSHEFLHRWGAYVKYKTQNGSISDGILGSKDVGGVNRVHWSYLFDTSGSLHYGNSWQDNGDGTFTSVKTNRYFSPLDLYLMGIIDKSAVPPMKLIKNDQIDREALPQVGATISGTASQITIEDIIAAVGERNPTAARSQKSFNLACLLIITPGQFKEENVRNLNIAMDNWAIWFSSLTKGKAKIAFDTSSYTELPVNPGVAPPAVIPRTTTPQIADGIAWLINHQTTDGNWTDSENTTQRDTANAVLALLNFQSTTSNVDSAVSWLDNNPSANTDYMARKIETLYRSSQDVTPFVSQMIARQNPDGGWGSGPGYLSNCKDTAIALRALAVAQSKTTDSIEKAISYLQTHQNPDNGWGSIDHKSDIHTTTDVLTAFGFYNSQYSLNTIIQNAVTWLSEKQNADGGFGNSPSTIYDTATALITLKDFGVSSDVINKAVGYLLTLQAEDGSWNQRVYETSLAVNAVYSTINEPELSLSTDEVTILPSQLTQLPQNVVIQAIIRNKGLTDVPATKICLYDGPVDNANKIAEQTISLAGNSFTPVTFNITVDSAGTHYFYLKVDPENTVYEWNESNNTVVTFIEHQATFDFALSGPDISISPLPVTMLQPVNIACSISNLGTTDAHRVPVTYYLIKGLVRNQIGLSYVDIPAGQSATAGITWNTSRAGNDLSIEVKADSFDQYSEVSEDNNTASVPILVDPISKPDLSVTYADIQVAPNPVRQGDNATITAQIQNNGYVTATDVDVEIFEGFIGQNETLLGTQTITTLDPGQVVPVQVQWPSISGNGSKPISVRIDPKNLIDEINENDNQAFALIPIDGLADFAVTNASLVFVPAVPTDGDLVIINITVQNKGDQPGTNVEVALKEAGTLIATKTIASLNGNSSETVNFEYDTTDKSGTHDLTVYVDPGNQIEEQDETNNLATRVLGVQNSDLWVSESFISPNGDGIKDHTALFFKLNQPQTLTPVIVDDKGQTVKHYEGLEYENITSGSIPWDGTDEQGRVVMDGEYYIQLNNDTGEILARQLIIVDNNRSPLTKALGTDYLLENNLTCELPDIDIKWLGDESGAVFSIDYQNSSTPSYTPGLYTVTPDGQDITRLIPQTWGRPKYWALSSTNEIAFFGSFDGEARLWKVNPFGENLISLDQAKTANDNVDVVKWSDDGNWVAYNFYGYYTYIDEVYITKNDGSQKNLIDTQPEFTLQDLDWSPDSQKIAWTSYNWDTEVSHINQAAIGGTANILFEINNYVSEIAWIDNSKILALESDNHCWNCSDQLWLYDTEQGLPLTKIADTDTYVIHPDHKGFVYVEKSADTCSLKYFDQNGQTKTLHESKAFESSDTITDIIWSPDGTKIAFVDKAYKSETECIYDGYLVVLDITSLVKKVYPVSDNVNLCGEMPSIMALEENTSFNTDSLRWLSDNISLIGIDSSGYFVINSENGERKYLDIDTSYRYGMDVSPGGRYITYRRAPDIDTVCYGKGWSDIWAMSSLLNLTADLRVKKETNQLVLSGTAADQNFSHYNLEYADSNNPDVWYPIVPPSDIPVANAIFADWIPPCPGNYMAKLTVFDKAGNQISDMIRITWGQSSSISNVYQTETLFSPNQDSIKDNVELHYNVNTPTHLKIEVKDDSGALVRQFVKQYDSTSLGPDFITWDGRDEGGVLMPDDEYTITASGYDFKVQIDNTPPEADLRFKQTSQGALTVDLEGYVFDDHVKEWIVEQGNGVNPEDWTLIARGSRPLGTRTADGHTCDLIKEYIRNDLESIIGKTLRITVVDTAGNQFFYIMAYTDQNIYPITWNAFNFSDVVAGSGCNPDSGLPTDALSLSNRIVFYETIQATISHLYVQYMDYTGQWQTSPDLAYTRTSTGDIQTTWNLESPDISHVLEIRLKVVDGNELEYYSQSYGFNDHIQIGYNCATQRQTARMIGTKTIERIIIQNQSDQGSDWQDYSVVCDASLGQTCPLVNDNGFDGLILWEKGDSKLGLAKEGHYRLVVEDADGTAYCANFDYPPDYECLQLQLEINRDASAQCNEIGVGKARLSLKTDPDYPIPYNVALKTVHYYIKKTDHFELLTQIDLESDISGKYILDTSQLSSGLYYIQAQIDYQRDNYLDSIVLTGSLNIEHELPSIAITSPIENSKVCPLELKDKNGLPVGKGIAVAGFVNDNDRIKGYELQFKTNESSTEWLPALDQDKKAIEGTDTKNGDLGIWDITDLYAFDGILRLKAWDENGNTSCYDIRFAVDPSIIPTIRLVNTIISPNNDSKLDEAGIEIWTRNPAPIDLSVFDQESTLKKSILVNYSHPAGKETIFWNGKDDAGNVLPDGSYKIVVSAVDPCGTIHAGSAMLEIDNTPPQASITSPVSGDISTNVLDIMGTAWDRNFAGYLVQAIQSDTESVQTQAAPIQDNSLGQWNTFGKTGSWSLKLTASDLAGNTSQASVLINLVARGDLIENMEASPKIFSPNNDGRNDFCEVSYILNQECNVVLDILNSAGQVRKTIARSSVAAGTNSIKWDGRDLNNQFVHDGLYTARLTVHLASDTSAAQVESMVLVVDTVAPVIELSAPAVNSYLKGNLTVSGTIEDPNIAEYVIYHQEKGQRIDLAQGNQSRQNYDFVNTPLAQGTYVLYCEAYDLAQNRTQAIIPFTIDKTAPVIDLTHPADNETFGATYSIISIQGSISEDNLDNYLIRYGTGSDPETWTTLTSNTELPVTQDLATWNVNGTYPIGDGLYTLSVLVRDKAGWESEVRKRIVIDNTAPLVRIMVPVDGGVIKQVTDIVGTISDDNLKDYRVEFTENSCDQPFEGILLKTGQTSIQDGVITSWRILKNDGPACLKITAQDKIGHVTTQTVQVTVDVHPPSSPVLKGQVVNKSDAMLSWTGNTEPDLAGYNLYRNNQKVNTGLITTTSYLCTDLAEGVHPFVVKAVDQAGWESESSNVVTLTIDRTPPSVRISVPQDGAITSGIIDIKGTAYSADDFKQYRIYISPAASPEDRTLIRTSPVPISYGVLATIDTSSLAYDLYVIQIQGEDISGNIAEHSVQIRIDNAAPSQPVLNSAQVDFDDVTLIWQANPEPDIAGYLIYRGYQLVNAHSLAIDNFTPYLITDTTYIDKDIADGIYDYYIVAVDQAGNLSDPSNIKQVSVDTHTPSARVTKPEDGYKFENPIDLLAESDDNDIAHIQFQYRLASNSDWIDLGPQITNQPFTVSMNPSSLGLSYGTYYIRAVATDIGNKTDAKPPAISIRYGDLTAPTIPGGLKAQTNGGSVTLSWTANTDTDLSGYNVYVVSGTSGDERRKLNSSVLTTTGYVHQDGSADLQDNTYFYMVTAVDADGNESSASDTAKAVVYKPSLKQAYTPSSLSGIDISGSNLIANAQMEVFINGTSLTTVNADDKGDFSLPVTLQPGENHLTAKALDSEGNISKLSDDMIVIYNLAPSVPTGLDAVVENSLVTLIWNSNPESDIAGYLVYRDGQKLNQDSELDYGTALASENGYLSYNAFDNDPKTYWKSVESTDGFKPVWWELQTSSNFIDHMEITWAEDDNGNLCAGKDFEIQVWSGYAWVTQFAVTGNIQKNNIFDFAPWYHTDRIRVFITDVLGTGPSKQVRIADIHLFRTNPEQSTTYYDFELPNGIYQYQIKAIDTYGFESDYTPELQVTVGDVIAPATPENLTAQTQQTDVLLAWESVSDSDLAGYNIYRNTGDSIVKVNPDAITATSYLDTNLGNATYTYHVKAVDTSGNESLPSESALATVYTTPPENPIDITASSMAEGGAIDICWQVSGNSPAGFNVYRATNPGGPYQKVTSAPVSGLCYTDQGLVNGMSYYYVVVAVDTVGNESGYSNEAAAVPADSVSPAAPVVFNPTIPGMPYQSDKPAVDMSGWAEPGTTISLYRDGILVDHAQATTADQEQMFTLDSDFNDIDIARDNRYITYAYSSDIWMKDLQTGQETNLASDGQTPLWSSKGHYIVYTYWDSDWNTRLGLIDIATLSVQPITEDPGQYEISPSWTTDETKLAMLQYRDGQWQLLVKDMIANTIEHYNVTNGVNQATISPDGDQVCYLIGYTLYLMNFNDSVVTLVSNNVSEYKWSPDGSRLAYTTGGNRIEIIDSNTLELLQTIQSATTLSRPNWSPDGKRLLYQDYIGSGQLEIVSAAYDNPADAQVIETLHSYGLRNLFWSQTGTIGWITGIDAHLLLPKGYFNFDSIDLAVGENPFRTTATDPSGNISDLSEEISVVFGGSNLPDLEILTQDIYIYPESPVSGDATDIYAFVKNTGNEDVENVRVQVALMNASGRNELLYSDVIGQINAHDEQMLTMTWDSSAKIGQNTVTVYIDKDNAIAERNESNNIAVKTFTVVSHDGLSMDVKTDSAWYRDSEDVQVKVNLTNPGQQTTAVLTGIIADENGNTIASLAGQDIIVASGTTTYTYTWNVGDTAASRYHVAFEVSDSQSTVLHQASAMFDILRNVVVGGSIHTDKAVYGADQNVVISASVANKGDGYILSDLSASITILDQTDHTVYSQDYPIDALIKGAPSAFKATWDHTDAGSGNYKVIMTVVQQSTQCFEISTQFRILPESLMVGQIKAAPELVAPNATLTAHYDLTNVGNMEMANFAITVTVMDPESETIIMSSEETVSVNPGQTYTGQCSFATGDLAIQSYRLVLFGMENGNLKQLATTPFEIRDIVAPVLTIESPQNNTTWTGAIPLRVSVHDNASGIKQVQYRINNGSWLTMPLVDAGQSLYVSQFEPLVSGEYVIYFNAVDMFGNESQSVSTRVQVSTLSAFDLLTGTVEIQPTPLYVLTPAQAHFSVANDTDTDLTDTLIRISIVDPQTGQTILSQEQALSLPGLAVTSGQIDFETDDLEAKTYQAVLEVQSSDLQRSRQLADMLFTVEQPLVVNPVTPDHINLLVWVNAKCNNGNNASCVVMDVLEQILAQTTADYLIVESKEDFQNELRNTYFTDILILGDQAPLTGHYDNELKEMVFNGKGLVSALFRSNPTDEVFGINFKGRLSDNEPLIQLTESIMGPAMSFTADGKPNRIEITGSATVVGTMQTQKGKPTEQNPAVVLNEYGNGRAIYLSFDLGNSLDDCDLDQMTQLIRNSVMYVHKAQAGTQYLPYAFVPVGVQVQSFDDNTTVRVIETFDDGLTLYDPQTGQWIADSGYTMELDMPEAKTVLLGYYYRMPDMAGTFNATTLVQVQRDGVFEDAATFDRQFVVENSSQGMVLALIDELSALNLTGNDKKDRDNALGKLIAVQDRIIENKADIASDISDILAAIEYYLKIDSLNMSQIRYQTGQLLEVMQTMYFYHEE